MYAKQVSRLYEPIEPISLPWELRSLVSDLTIQNGTRSARAIVRRRIMGVPQEIFKAPVSSHRWSSGASRLK